MIHDDEYPPTFWQRRSDRQLRIFVLVIWSLISGPALNWAFHHFV